MFKPKEEFMADFKLLAEEVVKLVGGPANIKKASHCISRLRFDVINTKTIQEDEIKKLDGIMGTQMVGKQFQVIIGPAVSQAFEEVEKILPAVSDSKLVEDGVPEKKTVGTFLLGLISHMAGCIYPALAVFVVSGLIRTIPTIFSLMLQLIPADNGFIVVSNFIGEACFYFLPIFIGYSSAKHFDSDPFIGMLMGAILIAPGFVNLVTAGEPFKYLGLPVGLYDYSSSVLPVILMVAIAAPLEKFLKKVISPTFHLLLVPVIVVFVMSILGLVVIAPLGEIIGQYLSAFIYWLRDTLGPIGIGLIAGTFYFLVMTGMHHTINVVAITAYLAAGYDDFLFVAFGPAIAATMGLAAAMAIKTKDPKVRATVLSCAFFQGIVGLGEPMIYGVLLQYPKAALAYFLGGLAGGIYAGVMKVIGYTFLGSNLLILLEYLGGTTGNLINGLISCIIAFAVSFILIWVLGYEKGEKKA